MRLRPSWTPGLPRPTPSSPPGTRASAPAANPCIRSTSRPTAITRSSAPTGAPRPSMRSTPTPSCSATCSPALTPTARRSPTSRSSGCGASWRASRSRICASTSRTATVRARTTSRTPTCSAPRPRSRPARNGGTAPPFTGIRVKSFEAPTRRRGLRTLAGLRRAPVRGGRQPGRLRHHPAEGHQRRAGARDVLRVRRIETALGLGAGTLRFEIQVETPQSILGPDGTALVARMVHASAGRCTALHYGTYDYSAFCGIAARVPEHGAPGRRPRQAGHAGRRRRHRRPAVRRLDQHAAGRRRRRGARRLGNCTCGWSAARSSAATTRAGTCTRPSCRRGYAATFALLPRRAAPRPPTGCADYVERERLRRSSTSRRPRARSPTSCCAASTAAP